MDMQHRKEHKTRQDAVEFAREHAWTSKRDYIVWSDKNNRHYTGRVTAENIKAAMLAVGTQGQFTMCEAGKRFGHVITWWIANNMRRQLLHVDK